MEKDAVIRLEIMKIYRGVRVSIIDNGSGMSDEVRESLLRLETKPHTKQSSGLGTSNVFRRLRLFYRCDNLINIHSELGKGTTVTITIPRKKDEPTDVPTIDRR
ncbi:Histidine kinase-, DNA gyrase B-, and HSP90-like ATPase [compost metagenome]